MRGVLYIAVGLTLCIALLGCGGAVAGQRSSNAAAAACVPGFQTPLASVAPHAEGDTFSPKSFNVFKSRPSRTQSLSAFDKWALQQYRSATNFAVSHGGQPSYLKVGKILFATARVSLATPRPLLLVRTDAGQICLTVSHTGVGTCVSRLEDGVATQLLQQTLRDCIVRTFVYGVAANNVTSVQVVATDKTHSVQLAHNGFLTELLQPPTGVKGVKVARHGRPIASVTLG